MRRVMAPMVHLSDLAFRALVAEFGATAVYTQMILAKDLLGAGPGSAAAPYHAASCCNHPSLRAVTTVLQLAGDDPTALAEATRVALRMPGVGAVDLNLGCPQDGARDGHYGSWLTDERDWPLVAAIIRAMADACAGAELPHKPPLIVKCRLQPTLELTLRFARLVQDSGASALVVHGRTRGSPQHRRAGLADLEAVSAVAASLSIPVVSNGNVCCHADVHANAATATAPTRGAAGVMSAEALLRDPALFDCEEHDCGLLKVESSTGEPMTAVSMAPIASSTGAGACPSAETFASPLPAAGQPGKLKLGSRSAIADHCCSKQAELIPPPFLPYNRYTVPQLRRLLADAERASRVISRYLELVSAYHCTQAPHDCSRPDAACRAEVVASTPRCDCGCGLVYAGGDFVDTPGLPLDKLLLHVQWMLGRYGGGSNVQYRFRGKHKPAAIKGELLCAASVLAEAEASSHVAADAIDIDIEGSRAARCRAPLLAVIKRRAVDEIIASAIQAATRELKARSSASAHAEVAVAFDDHDDGPRAAGTAGHD